MPALSVTEVDTFHEMFEAVPDVEVVVCWPAQVASAVWVELSVAKPSGSEDVRRSMPPSAAWSCSRLHGYENTFPVSWMG